MNEHEEKVRRLIALALNAGATDGESRNAAIQALRLIDKHGLLEAKRTGDPLNATLISSLQSRIRDLESQVRGSRMHDELLNIRIRGLNAQLGAAHIEIMGLKAEVMEEKRKSQAAEDRARRFRDYRPPSSASSSANTNGSKTRRKIIRSQYAGTCNRCKEPFEVGDRIAWRQGGGALHLVCYERELQEPA